MIVVMDEKGSTHVVAEETSDDLDRAARYLGRRLDRMPPPAKAHWWVRFTRWVGGVDE